MEKLYREFKGLNLPEIDQEIQAFWKEAQIFEKSVQQRPRERSFVFYEGPPSANGMPGIHHAMGRTVKDTFCRYQTLKGFRVDRKGGWDTHGLPIELQVEKELGITKEDIGKKISVEEYNTACRNTVMRYKGIWDDLTQKMGYWVDLEKPYITFTNPYIASVWGLLKKIYDKRTPQGESYLYKGFTIQPFSPAAGTGLSTHELNQPGCYREVTDISCVAMFKVKSDAQSAFLFEESHEDVRILAWTTTPWTLPSNVALTVGPNIDYVKVRTLSPYTGLPVSVILAKSRLNAYFSAENEGISFDNFKPNDKALPFNIAPLTIKGSDLLGVRYEQLIPMPELVSDELAEKGFRVISGDWVTTEDGTGVVHTAPYFGADDFTACKEAGIPYIGLPNEKDPSLPFPLVDRQGRFVPEVPEFGGSFVKEEYYAKEDRELKDFRSTDLRISLRLKEDNKAFKVEKYKHEYPHCWRTNKPVLYYPLDSWFIRASAAKKRMAELNRNIYWKPESTGTGRFGVWLDNLKDWNLSRSRYWGIPLPIWRTEDASEELCIGSEQELNAAIAAANNALGLNQAPLKDLHRPYIDEVVLVSPSGKPMRRELDLIDVWFDSGSMPYAQWGDLAATFAENQPKNTAWSSAHAVEFELLREHSHALVSADTPAKNRWAIMLQEAIFSETTVEKNGMVGEIPVDFIFPEKRLAISLDESGEGSAEINRFMAAYLHDFGYKHLIFSEKDHEKTDNQLAAALFKELCARPVFTKEELASGIHLRAPFGGSAGSAFPADFIAEGVDQTRGWFYTLHAISSMLYDSVAFKAVVSNGLVLDKNGNKMSKSVGNVVDPFEVISANGADATRWYMLSNASPWDNLKFSVEGIESTRNKVFITLYNTYSFFAMYANIDDWAIDEMDVTPVEDRPEIDRWVLSKVYSLVHEYRAYMDDYEPTKATRAVEYFVGEELSNWYVRLCRRRFWRGEMTADKKSAYETLFQCLMMVGQMMSPVAPFFSDWLYKNLTDGIRGKAKALRTPLRHESVHLSDLVETNESCIDLGLEQRMEYAQRICSLALSIRKKEGLRVRLPLQKILLPILDESFIAQVEGVKNLILSEINVKEIEYITDASGLIRKQAKANFKTLGKTLGKDMKAGAEMVAALTNEQINALERAGSMTLSIDGAEYSISREDLIVTTEDLPGWKVANDENVTVALDVTMTDSLEREGLARDFVNRLQNLRKDRDFLVTDRIGVRVQPHPELEKVMEEFGAYVQGEILAQSLLFDPSVTGTPIQLREDLEVLVDIWTV